VDLEATPSFRVLGLEPFSETLTAAYLKEMLQGKKKPIKSLLLDQTIFTGLGNIYVDEVLFRAKIHPLTQSSKLSEKELENVVKYTQEILKRAIELKGTTIKTFSSEHGVSGLFQNELRVHTRKGEPCPGCKTLIEKIKVGGRGTYFCPCCQKEHG
jgi:formamidopyrimidine-DNA glycosylase